MSDETAAEQISPALFDAVEQAANAMGEVVAIGLEQTDRARGIAVRLEQENAQAVEVVRNLLNHSSLTQTSWSADSDAVDAALAWLQANE